MCLAAHVFEGFVTRLRLNIVDYGPCFSRKVHEFREPKRREQESDASGAFCTKSLRAIALTAMRAQYDFSILILKYTSKLSKIF